MRINLPRYLISSFLVVSVSIVQAEDEGLSQLYFDKTEEAPRAVTPDDLVNILGESKPQLPVEAAKTDETRIDDQVVAESPSVAKQPEARAMLSVAPALSNETSLDESANYIIPRIKGPEVDGDSESKITSKAFWRRSETGTCRDVGPVSLCNKATALKETLRRFTGNDDFYDSQCVGSCADANHVPTLISLTVKDTKGGGFTFVTAGLECRYQLSKNATAPWMMLERSNGDCKCMPKSCN